VFGEITLEYAKDKLVYSKTLEEWRTHPGLDIGADLGEPVKAVADGVVADIKKDPRFGITIVLDHQNGLKTVYANLASDETVAVNQIIKQGEIIGSVGDTAAFESSEQSHLHFEVLLNGVQVDPADYLPEFKD
jgi:murein DD-endopeptidase MepM/ murein hydrolase activator NlpD